MRWSLQKGEARVWNSAVCLSTGAARGSGPGTSPEATLSATGWIPPTGENILVLHKFLTSFQIAAIFVLSAPAATSHQWDVDDCPTWKQHVCPTTEEPSCPATVPCRRLTSVERGDTGRTGTGVPVAASLAHLPS